MRYPITGALAATMLLAPGAAGAADDAEIAELKRMIQDMRSEYERRIDVLESRLERAERARAEPAQKQAAAGTGRGAVTSGNAFNPRISVILDGNYYADDMDGGAAEILTELDRPSHSHGGGHGHDGGGHVHGGDAEEGFNIRETEIVFSATVDPYFDASVYTAVSDDGDFELEEAWLQSRNLPAGFKLKAGKFFSGIGYANAQHPHQWDFTDQNLPYLNFFGGNLTATGLQATWLPELPVYTLLGLELAQGDDNDRFGAIANDEVLEEEAEELGDLGGAFAGVDEDAFDLDEEDNPRLLTAFLKVAPDLGYSHALQLGAFAAYNDQHQEIHGEAGDGDLHTLEGEAWLWGLDAVYKYDSPRAYGAGDVVLQGEYMREKKDLDLTFHQAFFPALPADPEREFTTDGFYLQGRYGIAPRWQAALRYDKLGMTNKAENSGSRLDDIDSSDRWTAALTWTPSEFSRFRLQWATADVVHEGMDEDLEYVYLQYVLSLGTHGAHKF